MKIKKKLILLLSFILITILTFGIILYNSISLSIYGDEEIELTVNKEYYELGCQAKFFNKPLSEEYINISGNLDVNKTGDYEITYSVQFFFRKWIVRKVRVVDDIAPDITLIGNKTEYLKKGQDYIEKGWTAFDNYDLDLTNQVEISGQVDTKKTGEYELSYHVVDSSNNETTVVRKVVVHNGNVLSLPISEFSLEGYFDDVKLSKDEKEYDYFDDTVLIGDSNITYLYTRLVKLHGYNLVKPSQIWGKPNTNIKEIINGKIKCMEYGDTLKSLDEWINELKPKYMIIYPGMDSINLSNKQIKEYVGQINDFMKNNHPDIYYTLMLILPITDDGFFQKGTQESINHANYYLLEACHDYKINVIDFAETIRTENGYGEKKYYNYEDNPNGRDRGFHLYTNGQILMINYLKHCNLERVVD